MNVYLHFDQIIHLKLSRNFILIDSLHAKIRKMYTYTFTHACRHLVMSVVAFIVLNNTWEI